MRNAARRLAPALFEQVARKSVADLYARFIMSGELCFDVGAHRGMRTKAMRSLGARVVAVEPQPELAEKLRRSFKRDNDVFVEAAGLSDQPGRMELHLAAGASTIATAAPHWRTGRFRSAAWERSISVPATTLDTLIRKFGPPVFCKIDVEGYEVPVLKGLSQPLRCISFEFTIEFIDEAARCLAYLAALAEIEVNLSLGETVKLHFTRWVTADEALDEIRRLGQTRKELWGDLYVRSWLD